MLKATAQPTTPRSTKDRIVEAAVETLRREGFAGTSARSIANRGGFNQALVFYHFGTINDLLLAALDSTSAIRMERYADAVKGVTTIEDAVRVATDLYREDLASGHITVLSELIAGSLDRPDLGPRIVERMQPWIDLATDAVTNSLSPLGLTELIAPRTIAYAIVALYLGVDMLSHLEANDAKAEEMFASARQLALVVGRAFPGR